MRLLRWLKNIAVGLGLRMKVNKFSYRLSELEDLRRKNNRDFLARRKELDAIKEALVLSEARLRETVDEALRIQKKYEIELEGTRDKIRVMDEVTVPALLQSNLLLFERWKAETAVQVGRRASFSIPTPTEGE